MKVATVRPRAMSHVSGERVLAVRAASARGRDRSFTLVDFFAQTPGQHFYRADMDVIAENRRAGAWRVPIRGGGLTP